METRSNLIDVSFSTLHALLSSYSPNAPEYTIPQLSSFLEHRSSLLGQAYSPFGSANASSRSKVQSGKVKLDDGSELVIEDGDKEYVWAITDKFGIDEVWAAVLMRSFLWNEGLPTSAVSAGGGGTSGDDLKNELLIAFTPFYTSERLSLIRLLIPLLRAHSNALDPLHTLSNTFLPTILPSDESKDSWIRGTLSTLKARRLHSLPTHLLVSSPRLAAQSALQALHEQLTSLELLFWSLWSFIPPSPPLILEIWKEAVDADLGSLSAQKNRDLLRGSTEGEVLGDVRAFWVVCCIEVLNLEALDPFEGLETSAEEGPALLRDTATLSTLRSLISSTSSHDQKDVYYAPLQLALNFLPRSGPFSVSGTNTEAQPQRITIPGGTFTLLRHLLHTTSLFNIHLAWARDSVLGDPGAVGLRSVLKGLLMATLDRVTLERAQAESEEGPEEVRLFWEELFGFGESSSLAPLTRQFWDYDYKLPPPSLDGNGGGGRRALLDIVRSRFPLQPLLPQFLSSLCGFGSQTTSGSSALIQGIPDDDISTSTSYVLHYFLSLPSFCMVLRQDSELGLANLVVRRPGSGAAGSMYTNLRALDFAGAGILPPNSLASLLGTTEDGGVVLCWEWPGSEGRGWNAWKFLLEILRAFVEERTGKLGVRKVGRMNSTNVRTGNAWYIPLSDLWSGNNTQDVGDILDLMRYVLGGGSTIAATLVEVLEGNADFSSASTLSSNTDNGKDNEGADLVELTTLILEDALSRRSSPSSGGMDGRIVVSSLSVLRSLLGLPSFATRVWLYLRSSTILFPPARALATSSSSRILQLERTTGHYPITLSLLSLLRALLDEFKGSLALTPPEGVQLKQEVFGRAVRFVTSEVWNSFWRWRFESVGDKFEMGRMLADVYIAILEGSAPKVNPLSNPGNVKTGLMEEVALYLENAFGGGGESDVKLVPLVETLRGGARTIDLLFKRGRYADARILIRLVEGVAVLTRGLVERRSATAASNPGAVGGTLEKLLIETDTISTIASYISNRSLGSVVPMENAKLLCALAASSLINSNGTSGGLYKQLYDPESRVRAFVRIARHPYDDMHLRIAIWELGMLCVQHQPALARLFVQGTPVIPASDVKGKSKAAASAVTLLSTGLDILLSADDLWDGNPQLLASVLAFLDSIWAHAGDHESALKPVRADKEFWSRIESLTGKDLGPPPEVTASISGHVAEGVEAVTSYAYRAVVKAKALHILAMDIQNEVEGKEDPQHTKSGSWDAVAKLLVEDQLIDHVMEGITTSFNPTLHASVILELGELFPSIDIETISLQSHPVDREFGQDYLYPLQLLRERLALLYTGDPLLITRGNRAIASVAAMNLNWSLADAQMMLTKAWRVLLQKLIPHARSKGLNSVAMVLAENLSTAIAAESRSGPVIVIAHSERLQLLLTSLEVAWFNAKDDKSVKAFVAMASSFANIVSSQVFPPLASMRNRALPPYHMLVLQAIFYFARKSRMLLAVGNTTLHSAGHLEVLITLRAALLIILEGLREAFDAASNSQISLVVEADIQLLTAAFHQCTRKEISLPSSEWLTTCRELSLCEVSLKLLDSMSCSDRPYLVSQILFFQLSLTSTSATARQLAEDGCLATFSRLPMDLPSELWCIVLSIISSLVSTIGYEHNFIEFDICAFIQVHGERIAQVLSWTIDDAVTMSFLEELERVTELFYVIAKSCRPFLSKSSLASQILQAYNGPSLALLQQLNYGFAHPNHLVSLIDPSSAEERSKLATELPKGSSYSLAELVDASKKPTASAYVQRLAMITNNLLLTLLVVSGAGNILGSHRAEWETAVHPLLTPHAKVSLSEPASIGTISELASSASNILKTLTSSTPKLPTLAVHMVIVQQLVETALTLASTQIVAWLNSQTSPDVSGDMDVDEFGKSKFAGSNETQDRRASLSLMTSLSGRVRRDLTGELAVDMAALLTRCQTALEKAGVGKQANMALLLRGFLEERVMSVAA